MSIGYGPSVSVFDLKLEDTVDIFYEGLWTYLESASDQGNFPFFSNEDFFRDAIFS